jgi:multidrug transporter EmrE-like cation transporter
MSLDPVQMKQQMTRVTLVSVALAAIAMAFAVAHFAYGVAWALWGFIGFLVVGFVVQIWFIRGVLRAAKGS